MDLLHLHPSNNGEHLSKNGQLAASLKNNGTSSKKEGVGEGRTSIHKLMLCFLDALDATPTR